MYYFPNLLLLKLSAIFVSGVLASSAFASIVVVTPQFEGKLYSPPEDVRATGVVFIGGSEGGLIGADAIGPKIALMGFQVLGVKYHDGFMPGKRLAQVPLETFSAAAAWLAKQPNVKRVVLVGESRGTEAALLTSLHAPQVVGVVGYVPSGYVWPAVGESDANGPSAWTKGGESIPFVRSTSGGAQTPEDFLKAVLEDGDIERKTIPVESIPCEILLLGADDDAIWPSGVWVREMAARHKARGGKSALVARTYENAGHRLLGTGPSAPTETFTWGNNQKFTAKFGGTDEGNLRARNAAWAELLRFLTSFEK